jgi:lysozyme
MTVKGIDISQWQGNIDLSALKNQVGFVIIRLGYSTQKDQYAERNMLLCESLGIPFGCYWYCYAANTNGAMAEAKAMVAALGSHKPAYPMYYDIEDNSLPSGTTLIEIAKTFCNYLESQHFYAGVYSSLSWFNSRLSGLSAFDHWVAEWGSACHYKGEFGMWQYTSDGHLDGYNGRLDMNLAYKDYPGIIKAAGLNGFIKSEPTPVTPVAEKKSVTQIANEVIAGAWGNGTARKEALAAAGYDYATVQKKVDEILHYNEITVVARQVIAGKWGVYPWRRWRLQRAGYNYSEVQTAVNQIMKGNR